jgi:hypothetical protein
VLGGKGGQAEQALTKIHKPVILQLPKISFKRYEDIIAANMGMVPGEKIAPCAAGAYKNPDIKNILKNQPASSVRIIPRRQPTPPKLETLFLIKIGKSNKPEVYLKKVRSAAEKLPVRPDLLMTTRPPSIRVVTRHRITAFKTVSSDNNFTITFFLTVRFFI